MSNNSHKERINSEIGKINPNHITELLNSLEKWTRSYKITSKVLRDSIKIIFKEKKTKNLEINRKCIRLSISNDPKFYLINLFEISNNGTKNTNKEKFEELYQIKVEGDYELSSIENDIKKLIKSKNITHSSKYYPF